MKLTTTNTPAFGGRVIFQCTHATPRTGLLYKRLTEAAKELPLLKKFSDSVDSQEEVDIFASQIIDSICMTQDIEFKFQGDENTMLLDLQTFWKKYKQQNDLAKQMALAFDFRMKTNNVVMEAFTEAITIAQLPFRDPVMLPESALTEEEKAALALGTPLETSEKQDKKSSSTE